MSDSQGNMKKTPFGGFKREDVLDYVENLQNQLLESQKKQKEAESKAVDKNDSNESKFKELREKCEKLEAELSESENAITKLKAEKEEIKTEKENLIREKEELVTKLDECIGKINDYDTNLASLQTKLDDLKKNCENLTDSEQQVNTLVMDAVVYSDKIIGKAKDAAKGVSEDAKQAISSTAEEIDGIGFEISKITADFGDVIARLSMKLGALSKEISELTDRFEIPDEEDDRFYLREDGLSLLDEIYMRTRKNSEDNK